MANVKPIPEGYHSMASAAPLMIRYGVIEWYPSGIGFTFAINVLLSVVLHLDIHLIAPGLIHFFFHGLPFSVKSEESRVKRTENPGCRAPQSPRPVFFSLITFHLSLPYSPVATSDGNDSGLRISTVAGLGACREPKKDVRSSTLS